MTFFGGWVGGWVGEGKTYLEKPGRGVGRGPAQTPGPCASIEKGGGVGGWVGGWFTLGGLNEGLDVAQAKLTGRARVD